MKRITVLDGWRGVAILLVLFDHVQFSLHGGYPRPWMQTGQHGVTIFFVLSGFLITSKLIEKPIDLRRFYTRRFCRLMPAAWTYLAMLVVVGAFMHVPLLTLKDMSACVFFYRNFYDPVVIGPTGHFWSLSLEEQFYLVWPCLLLLAGARRCRWIAACGAIAIATYRTINWSHYNANIHIFDQSQVRADALLVGCLLALLLADTRVRSAAQRISQWWMAPAAAVVVYCIATFHWLPPLTECVAAAWLMAAMVLHPQSMMARIFSFAPLAWIGTVSYSVYIWQEIFTPFHTIWVWLFAMPVFALGSYYLIERPGTDLGHRLTAASEMREKASA